MDLFSGYRDAGFLAYLYSNLAAPSGTDPLPFDTEAYDYSDNYNTSTGIYTVPYDGLYLVHVRINGMGSHR